MNFCLVFPLNLYYYKVDYISCMGNSCCGLNLSNYDDNTICNNRRKISCVDADEPCIRWAWDLDTKQRWAPGCSTIKCDNLEERTSSALIFSSPHPPFLLTIHTSNQTTQEICTNPRGESGMGKKNKLCRRGLGVFYFFSSWKLSVAVWNKISFARGSCIMSMYDSPSDVMIWSRALTYIWCLCVASVGAANFEFFQEDGKKCAWTEGFQQELAKSFGPRRAPLSGVLNYGSKELHRIPSTSQKWWLEASAVWIFS